MFSTGDSRKRAMRIILIAGCIGIFSGLMLPSSWAADFEELDPAYYHTGELAGSLRSADAPSMFDADPQHLWNRLYAAATIRPSLLPSKREGMPIARIEGGDRIEFLGWGGTSYYDESGTLTNLEKLLDQFLETNGEKHSSDPLKRVLLQRDLWTLFDFMMQRQIDRKGDLETREQRNEVCRKLARVIQALALPAETLKKLPDNYRLAIQSGHFATTHNFDPQRNYLPPTVLTDADDWQELDFYQATRSEDVERRYVFLHMRAFQGRSYFRVFLRFPKGRSQLEAYLKEIDSNWIDWRKSAQHGSISLKPGAPPLPEGTEVMLMQFLIALDPQLKLVPTSLCESVRLLIYKNSTGMPDPATNLGNGVNASKYTLKRRLALSEGGMRHGGLHREPDDLPVYRVLFEIEKAKDWGGRGRYFQLTADCRSGHSGTGTAGIQTIGSMINTASVDSGAALGVSRTLAIGAPSPHPARTVKWKMSEETYRRLLEYLGQ
ncbi:MAG: hypothetical protein JWM11_7273 [Planctomycetaceae bacterium]|nr:hypothetical protein [Planctomycetaceae bacterium]